MSSSRVVMSFRRVELNVFSSSRVEFLPSRMSFHRSTMPIRRVPNACSSSHSAYSLSCNNRSLHNVTFPIIGTVIYAWVQIFPAFHISLHGLRIFFYFPAISIVLISPSRFHGLQTLILLPIVGAYLVFLYCISKAGSTVGRSRSRLICEIL